MAVSVADLSVKMSANASGMSAGLRVGKNEVKMLAAEVKTQSSIGSKAFNAMSSAASGVGTGISSIAASGPAVLASFAGAAVAAAAAIGSFAVKGFEAIDASADMAARFGITQASMVGMNYAAKQADVEVDSLHGGMTKMVQALGKAVTGSDDAAAAFTGIGLNVSELQNMAPDQVFGTVADAIAKIQDPYERAAAAQKIFGKGALELTPLLLGGSAALDEANAATLRFGTAVSDVDVAKIAEADASFKQVQEAVTGLASTVAVELAPYFVDATQKLVAFITEGDGLKSKVGTGVEYILTGVGYLTDSWNILRSAIDATRGVVAKVLGIAIQGIGKLLEWQDELVGGIEAIAGMVGIELPTIRLDKSTIEGIKQFGDDLQAVGDDAFESAGKHFTAGMNGEGSNAVDDWAKDTAAAAERSAQATAEQLKKVREQQAAAAKMDDGEDPAGETKLSGVNKQIADAQKQLEQIGKTPIDIKLDELKGLGASNEQLATMRKTLEQIDAGKQAIADTDQKQRDAEAQAKEAQQQAKDAADEAKRKSEQDAKDLQAWQENAKTSATSLDSRSAEAQIRRDQWERQGKSGAQTIGKPEVRMEKLNDSVDKSNEYLAGIKTAIDRQTREPTRVITLY